MYETRGRIENLIESETTKGNGAKRARGAEGWARSATYPVFFYVLCEFFDETKKFDVL